MRAKVEFDGSCSGIGRVKERDESELIFMGHHESPLMDDDVKTVYLPEEVGGGIAIIKERYLCVCPHCNASCVAVITNKEKSGRNISVLHCLSRQDFSFVLGTLERIN